MYLLVGVRLLTKCADYTVAMCMNFRIIFSVFYGKNPIILRMRKQSVCSRSFFLFKGRWSRLMRNWLLCLHCKTPQFSMRSLMFHISKGESQDSHPSVWNTDNYICTTPPQTGIQNLQFLRINRKIVLTIWLVRHGGRVCIKIIHLSLRTHSHPNSIFIFNWSFRLFLLSFYKYTVKRIIKSV